MNKDLFKLISIFFLSVFLIPEAIIAQKQIDIKNTPAPLFRDPVFDGPADPTLIWEEKAGEWWMFYTQRRANAAFDGVAYCYGTAIGIAKSQDYGKTWSYYGIANLPQPNKGHNTFWAPQVIYDKQTKQYHLFVTYIKGIFNNWGGERQLFHYTSNDLIKWEFAETIGTKGCIDASVIQLNNGTWKMWYKDETRGAHTISATSTNLFEWKITNNAEVSENAHEGPIIFYWKNKYWMLTDNWNGLDCYESDDAIKWKHNSTILNEPGTRPDDNVMGRHADVQLVDGKAYIFYFTHPGRIYSNGKEVNETGQIRYQRTSLQVAELEIINGKIICNRDKYKAENPHKIN